VRARLGLDVGGLAFLVQSPLAASHAAAFFGAAARAVARLTVIAVTDATALFGAAGTLLGTALTAFLFPFGHFCCLLRGCRTPLSARGTPSNAAGGNATGQTTSLLA